MSKKVVKNLFPLKIRILDTEIADKSGELPEHSTTLRILVKYRQLTLSIIAVGLHELTALTSCCNNVTLYIDSVSCFNFRPVLWIPDTTFSDMAREHSVGVILYILSLHRMLL